MAHAENAKTEVAEQTKAAPADSAILEALRTLKLEIGAPLAQVKKAHRDLVRRMHPDTKGGSIEAFVKVQTAYEILTGKRSPEKTLEVVFAIHALVLINADSPFKQNLRHFFCFCFYIDMLISDRRQAPISNAHTLIKPMRH